VKKIILILLIISLVTGLIFSGCGQPASTTPSSKPNESQVQTQPIKLIFAHYDTEFGAISSQMKAWAKELEERSNGRVKVEFSWASGLGPMSEFYNMLSQGVCDIASLMPIMRPGLVSYEEIPSLPWSPPDAVSYTKALYALYDKGYFQKDFEDVKILYTCASGGSTVLFSSSSIKSLKDMKGKLFTTGSGSLVAEIEAMGGTISWVPPQDNYSALVKKTVDGSTGVYAMLEPTKLIEVVDYAIPAFGSLSLTIAMNQKTWNKLPADIQAIIDDLNMKYGLKTAEAIDQDSETGKQAFLAQGKEVNSWSQQDIETMDKSFTPIWDKFIADNEAKGIQVKDAVNLFWNSLKEQGIEKPAIGYTPK
jgi:TRAP-type transport system periplasmic protein